MALATVTVHLRNVITKRLFLLAVTGRVDIVMARQVFNGVSPFHCPTPGAMGATKATTSKMKTRRGPFLDVIT